MNIKSIFVSLLVYPGSSSRIIHASIADSKYDEYSPHLTYIRRLQLNILSFLPWFNSPSITPAPTPPPHQICSCCILDHDFNSTQVGKNIDGGIENGRLGAGISLSGDGLRLAAAEKAGLRIYDYSELNQEWEISGNFTDYLNDFVVSVSISIDGNHLIAGQQNSISLRNTYVGSVYVFKYEDDTWSQSGNSLSGEEGDGFGRSVDISGDGNLIVVGAPNGSYASVYTLEGFFWELNFIRATGNFGYSVALSSDGTRVAMGTPSPDAISPGSVFIFDLFSKDLVQQIDGDRTGDDFGLSVDLSSNGKRLVVGAPSGDYVKVYRFIDTNFEELVRIQSSKFNVQFGRSVAISANGLTVAVGSPFFNGNGNDIGKTSVYKVVCREYNEFATFIGNSTREYSGYSVSLSKDGSSVAFSALNNTGAAIVGGGQVRVFGFERA